jgi:hypothetical protein
MDEQEQHVTEDGELVDGPLPVDDDPDQTEGADEVAPEPEPEPEQHEARDDTEIDAVYTKLETRAKNYFKSVGEILEGGGVPVSVCELCADAYPGLRWVEPRDQMHAALVSAVQEISAGAPLRDDPNAEVCSVCDGFGAVKLPSRVDGNQIRPCKACNGAGYRELNAQSGTPQAPTPAVENGEVEAFVGVPLDDPSVVDLRARGFTVIPPMQPAQTVE